MESFPPIVPVERQRFTATDPPVVEKDLPLGMRMKRSHSLPHYDRGGVAQTGVNASLQRIVAEVDKPHRETSPIRRRPIVEMMYPELRVPRVGLAVESLSPPRRIPLSIRSDKPAGKQEELEDANPHIGSAADTPRQTSASLSKRSELIMKRPFTRYAGGYSSEKSDDEEIEHVDSAPNGSVYMHAEYIPFTSRDQRGRPPIIFPPISRLSRSRLPTEKDVRDRCLVELLSNRRPMLFRSAVRRPVIDSRLSPEQLVDAFRPEGLRVQSLPLSVPLDEDKRRSIKARIRSNSTASSSAVHGKFKVPPPDLGAVDLSRRGELQRVAGRSLLPPRYLGYSYALLKSLKQIFDKFHIPYFLTGGALLGIARYPRSPGVIHEWDDDIDIGIMDKNARELFRPRVLKEFKKRDLQLFYHPVFGIKVFNRNGDLGFGAYHSKSASTYFNRPDLTVNFARPDFPLPFVDLVVYRENGDRFEQANSEMRTKAPGKYFLRNELLPFQTKTVGPIDGVSIPGNIEGYLNRGYPGWKRRLIVYDSHLGSRYPIMLQIKSWGRPDLSAWDSSVLNTFMPRRNSVSDLDALNQEERTEVFRSFGRS